MLSVLECHGPCMRLLVVAVLSLAACAPVAAPPSRGDDNARAPATSGPCAELPADVASGSHGVLEQTRGALSGLVVLMGGGSEVDRGSAQFVEAALGGDVLVLRASGSTESYTSYFAQELVVDLPPASVTTLLLDDPSLAADPAVLCRIDGAEAIWLAGGDQADYLVRWPEQLRAAIARAVNDGVAAAAIGGWSSRINEPQPPAVAPPASRQGTPRSSARHPAMQALPGARVHLADGWPSRRSAPPSRSWWRRGRAAPCGSGPAQGPRLPTSGSSVYGAKRLPSRVHQSVNPV